MKVYVKPECERNSLGLFVTLNRSSGSRFLAKVTSDCICRKTISIDIPTTGTQDPVWAVVQILDYVKNGGSWSVRMSWDNVSQFFTMEQIKRMDSLLSPSTISLYGVPKQIVKEASTERILEAKKDGVRVRSFTSAIICTGGNSK